MRTKGMIRRFATLVIAAVVITAGTTPRYARAAESGSYAVTAASDETLQYGDYKYEVNDDGKTVTITRYIGTAKTDVTIPRSISGMSVTGIGTEAFFGCDSITSIDIPDSVTSIGNYAFSECISLISVDIPDSVTSIEYAAFSKCENLTRINIPDGVNCIETALFEFCRSLTSIDIPDSVTSIGTSAFQDCTSLTSVDIPSNVTTIGDAAFAYCLSLTSIDIPGGVTRIGDMVLAYDSCLTSISVREDNAVYDSRGDCNAIIETAGNTLIQGCVNTVIPATVTSIGYAAFHGMSSLTGIDIPSGVTSIEASAFMNCHSLTSIEIPYGVTSIGEEAFSTCESLTSIDIPSSVTSIGDGAFWMCRGLRTVDIPSGVTSIGDRAFYECWSLTGIEIPGSVTSIGNYAFFECIGLMSIEIPSGVTTIGTEAFSRCESIARIEIPGSVTSIGDSAFKHCYGLISIEMPSGVTSIGTGIFDGCNKLTMYCTENSVAHEYAVANHIRYSFGKLPDLYNLENAYNVDVTGITDKIYTGAEVTQSGVKVAVTKTDGESATNLVEGVDYEVTYENNTNVGTATVTITGKGNYTGSITKTFKITPMDISDETGKIEVSGIADNIPYTGGSITQDSIEVKSGVIALERGVDYTVTYKNNKNVGTATVIIKGKGNYTGEITKTFTITVKNTPDASNKVEVSGIVDCVAFTGKPITQSKLTVTSDKGLVLSVGTDYTLTYKNNTNVGTATVIIKGKGNYTGEITKTFQISLKKNATYKVGNFKYKVTNTAVGGKGTVTLVGTSYKKTNKKFSSFTIPGNVKIGGVSLEVTSIGAGAFKGYTNLKKVTVGSNVTTIGANAFSGCKKLTSVSLGGKLTTVGSKAFYGDRSLKTISIASAKLKTVGKSAFSKISTKPVVKVSKSKLSSYKKLMKRGGVTAKAVYKKR